MKVNARNVIRQKRAETWEESKQRQKGRWEKTRQERQEQVNDQIEKAYDLIYTALRATKYNFPDSPLAAPLQQVEKAIEGLLDIKDQHFPAPQVPTNPVRQL
jgi:hypothetical protein